jgi:hypothetical protein
MNNEQQQIIDEVFGEYSIMVWRITNMSLYDKEEFISKIKTNPEFSEKWGLKIEERELSIDEKEWQLEKTNCINDIENDRIIYGHEWEKYIQEQYEGIQSSQGIKIPTKLITTTYNNETIAIYE